MDAVSLLVHHITERTGLEAERVFLSHLIADLEAQAAALRQTAAAVSRAAQALMGTVAGHRIRLDIVNEALAGSED